jgi:uncharacterized protein YbbK (DUF523 family)
MQTMTDRNYINQLRIPTVDDPLRVLLSACLAGVTCGYDGTANGTYPSALKLLTMNTLNVFKFCPEEFSFGSPREMCDIYGGNGFDVLKGTARVLTETGIDWTEGMIAASRKMLEIARNEKIELAVLMDVSAACGSQVVYSGNRFAKNKVYQIGAGVCAAQLINHGFKVISQRDFASLELLYAKADLAHVVDEKALDHHEIPWYKEYFGTTAEQ